ncbi:MAG: DUF3291 domain-containing protein [Chitinophagia bacterium]
MQSRLIIVRYARWLFWAGFLSMAIFRFFLILEKKIAFWRLMGCGKNGTFDIVPDIRQWAVLIISEQSNLPIENCVPPFLTNWWKFFSCERYDITLQPLEGHGTWNGREVFGKYPPEGANYTGRIAVLTRATIRLSQLRAFWKNVQPVAATMVSTPGFITSVGIGEIPWIKQATFSVWESKEQMKQFAYRMHSHQQVIKKTRQEKWYSEDMFVRFAIISTSGTLRGMDPINPTSNK